MKKSRFSIGLSSVIMVLFACTGAYAAEPLHARVSYEAGDTMIKGGGDADWSYATANTLVLPGDVVWSDKDGTVEMEMAGGTFLRMADGSKAEMTSLPPSALIRGWTGSFYIQRTSRSNGTIKFQTPVCTVEVTRDSQVRLDLVRDGATTITVRWGRAYVSTEGGGAPLEIERGTRSYVDPGYMPSPPMPFDLSAEDAFDAWNRERTRLIALGNELNPPGHAVKNVPIGYSDLSTSGEWVHIDSDYFWRPTVVVDFVPYRSGHWSFVSGCGYVWVGDYPFSYVTSHYGRWHHHDRYGWVWTYRDEWSPAWVYSCRVGSNFVWAPLDPWDRPCVYGSHTDVFVLGDGISFSISTSTYCPVDSLLIGPCPVIPLTPVICHNIPPADITFWNLYTGGRRPHYAPSDNVFQVRDYSPRRVIRGLDSYKGQKDTAPIRARALETQMGRPDFAPKEIRTRQAVRTSTETATRSAQVREVSLKREAFSDVRMNSPRSSETATVSRGRTLDTTTKLETSGRASRTQETTQPLPRPMRSNAATNARTMESTTPDQDTNASRTTLRNQDSVQELPALRSTTRQNATTRNTFPSEPQDPIASRGRGITESTSSRESRTTTDLNTRSLSDQQNRTTSTLRTRESSRESAREIDTPTTTRSRSSRGESVDSGSETRTVTSPLTRERSSMQSDTPSESTSRNSRSIERDTTPRSSIHESATRGRSESSDSEKSTSSRSRSESTPSRGRTER